MKNLVMKKSLIMMKMLEVTTTQVVVTPTPRVPPSVLRPFQQAVIAIKNANTTVFASPVVRSAIVSVSKVLDMKKGAQTHEFKGHRGSIKQIYFNPDYQKYQIISISEEGTIKIFDLVANA